MLKRFILWDFPRASWQYDVMVGLILAFVFLTPREWFRDQPRIPHAGNILMLPPDQGTDVYWVEPELLADVPAERRAQTLSEILRKPAGRKKIEITRVEPIYDSEQEIKGYMAFVRP